MSNTFIEPGSASFEEMLADIKEGVYVKDWYGGTTSLEMFTFSAGEAYMIRRGKIAELLRPVVLTGNVFTTLENIDAIGDDLEMNQGGGCGKAGQSRCLFLTAARISGFPLYSWGRIGVSTRTKSNKREFVTIKEQK